MAVATLDKLAPSAADREGLTELRVETLKGLMLILLGLGYAAVVATTLGIQSPIPLSPWDPLPPLVGLSGTAGAMYWALRRGPSLATITLVIGATTTLTGMILLHPGQSDATYFFLIVLAVTGVYGWPAGLGTALLASGIVFFLTGVPGRFEVIPSSEAYRSIECIWTTLIVAWLLMRPLRTTIGWSWSNYELARSNEAIARQRQGELAQLSKSLNEACDRLERLNEELQDARAAADKARRMKAEFAATVGHELRTPINLIIGFSQMIVSSHHESYYDEPLPESYRDDIEAIHRNARHISSLVDDVLDLSQIDAHRMALHKTYEKLAPVADEAVANVSAFYDAAHLTLTVDIPDDLPAIPIDSVRIRQVLINLLYNAIRFTQQGGARITARVSDHHVVVAVCDTGVGIPADDLPRLFEEFRQFHPSTRGHGGSGLGLAVCKRFIELHGGSIWADSTPELGTTISFSLPVHDNITTSPIRRARPTATKSFGERRVVTVFDSMGDTTRILERYLDLYDVRQVKSLADTHAVARAGDLRVLITTSSEDEQVWHEYQHAHPDLHRVRTIVCPLRTRRAIATALGATEYLVKPVTRQHLATAIRRVCRRPRQIVIVEDEPDMRSFLIRLLRPLCHRCEIVEADNGADGVNVIRAVKPDLVLLDLLMPTLNGQAVLQELRADSLLCHVPVIVISAKGPGEEVTAGLIGVSHHDGFSVGEAMSFLRLNLDAIWQPELANRSLGELTVGGFEQIAF